MGPILSRPKTAEKQFLRLGPRSPSLLQKGNAAIMAMQLYPCRRRKRTKSLKPASGPMGRGGRRPARGSETWASPTRCRRGGNKACRRRTRTRARSRWRGSFPGGGRKKRDRPGGAGTRAADCCDGDWKIVFFHSSSNAGNIVVMPHGVNPPKGVFLLASGAARGVRCDLCRKTQPAPVE